MVLVVNTTFPELDHLAAGLAQAEVLSRYVRPYASLGRGWEQLIPKLPLMNKIYRRTFDRRRLPAELRTDNVCEVALVQDYALAIAQRTVLRGSWGRGLCSLLVDARTRAVAKAGVRAVRDQDAVVAGWGCAEPVFRKMKDRGAVCVLNYSFAHHRFARVLLREEAECEPAFADNLNNYGLHRWLEERFDQEVVLADRILVGSSFARESFLTEGVPAEKLEVIPYGVNQKLFKPVERMGNETGRSFHLLFVGHIGQRKGIAYLLRAYKQFRGPGTRLTLVGVNRGNDRGLQQYRGLFDHIEPVPRLYLADIYRQADVFVFPTLVEGMPLVVLEAMASGLPVITTRNGPGDIVRDGVDGFVVPIRDVDAIVDRLERLRRDPELRAQMGRNARGRALEFTWEAYRRTAVARIRQWLC